MESLRKKAIHYGEGTKKQNIAQTGLNQIWVRVFDQFEGKIGERESCLSIVMKKGELKFHNNC